MNQEKIVRNIADSLQERVSGGGMILVRTGQSDPPLFRSNGPSPSALANESRLIEEFPNAWTQISTLRTVLSKAISAAWTDEVEAAEQSRGVWPRIILSYNALVAATLASRLANEVGADFVQPDCVDPREGCKISQALQLSDSLAGYVESLRANLASSSLNATADCSSGESPKWALLKTARENGETTVTWFNDDGAIVDSDSMLRVVRRNLGNASRHTLIREMQLTGRFEQLENEESRYLRTTDKLAACAPRLNQAVVTALDKNETVGVWLFGYHDSRGNPTEVMAFVRPEYWQIHLCVRQGVADFAIGSESGRFFYFCPSQVQARIVIDAMQGEMILEFKRPEVCVPAGYPQFRHRYTDHLSDDSFSESSFVGVRPDPAIPPVSERLCRDLLEGQNILKKMTMPRHGYRCFCIHHGKQVANEYKKILRREFSSSGGCPTFPAAVRRVLRQGEQLLKHAHERNKKETPMAGWDKMLHPIDLKRAREWLGHRVYPYSP